VAGEGCDAKPSSRRQPRFRRVSCPPHAMPPNRPALSSRGDRDKCHTWGQVECRRHAPRAACFAARRVRGAGRRPVAERRSAQCTTRSYGRAHANVNLSRHLRCGLFRSVRGVATRAPGDARAVHCVPRLRSVLRYPRRRSAQKYPQNTEKIARIHCLSTRKRIRSAGESWNARARPFSSRLASAIFLGLPAVRVREPSSRRVMRAPPPRAPDATHAAYSQVSAPWEC